MDSERGIPSSRPTPVSRQACFVPSMETRRGSGSPRGRNPIRERLGSSPPDRNPLARSLGTASPNGAIEVTFLAARTTSIMDVLRDRSSQGRTS